MNRNNRLAQQQIALAQQRLQSLPNIPRGARSGALGQQALANPQAQVPQGADAGNLAGCGDNWGGCASGYIESPFSGFPQQGIGNQAVVQPNSLLGIFVQPASASPTTLEISCGNTFFNACGARSFTPAGTNLLTSIVSGFDTRDQLCPGSGIDVAFFQTDDCYCPFYFGCFSNLAPLLMTFDPVDTQSVLEPLNMVLVGDRLEFDGCFPYPPGMVPGLQPAVAAPGAPNSAINPGPWPRRGGMAPQNYWG
jgi:hypothetical protein